MLVSCDADTMIKPVMLIKASRKEILRREIAMRAVDFLTKLERPLRVSEMRAEIVETIVRIRITTDKLP